MFRKIDNGRLPITAGKRDPGSGIRSRALISDENSAKAIPHIPNRGPRIPDNGSRQAPARELTIVGVLLMSASRTATFTRALQNMKTLAEGGTLAPR